MARIVLPHSDPGPGKAPQTLGAVHLDSADPDLARRILPILGMRTSFVLLSADDPAAPPSLANPPPESVGKAYEVIRLRCTPAVSVAAILAECCRRLEIVPAGDAAAMHRAVTAKLQRQARQGVNSILLLEDAGQLADATLLAIRQLFRVGAHCLLPTLLVATPAFLERLRTPALDPLREAIAAHFRVAPLAPGAAPPARRPPEAPADAAASASDDSLAVMVQQAERLLKNLGTARPDAAPPPPAVPDQAPPPAAKLQSLPSAPAAEVEDLATVLRSLRDQLAPASAAVESEGDDGPAVPPTASAPPEKEKLPVAAARDARRWRSAAAAPVFAVLYVVGSLAVGGGVIYLWQSQALARSAEWLAARSWFPALPALDRFAVTAPEGADKIRPAAGTVDTEATSAAPEPATEAAGPERIVVDAGTYALSTELGPSAPPTAEESAQATPEPAASAAASGAAAEEVAASPVAVGSPEPEPERAASAAASGAAAEEVAASPVAAASPEPEPEPAASAAASGAASETVAAPPAAAAPPEPEPAHVEPAPAVQTANLAVAAPDAAKMAAAPAVPPAQLEVVVNRGDEVLKTGDIAAARLLYGWAASAGDARAALALGKTHDPLYLAQTRVRGAWADRAKAIEWYRVAEARGSREAAARLASLLEKSAGAN